MKKVHLFIFLLFAPFVALFSQVPNTFNYQAVVRNSSGDIISNQSVSFRISILEGSETGTAVYSEIHTLTTNKFGLANFEIGNGENKTGTFSPIGWGATPYFVKIELDPAGGTAFSELGTSKLTSVPYAFMAQTVVNDAVDDADADPSNEIQTLKLTGTYLELSNGGGSVTLPTTGSSGGDNWGVQTVKTDATLIGDGTSTSPLSVVADGDGDDTNELQTLSKTDNAIELSNGGGSVTIDVEDADADSTNEIQVLSLNGTLLELSNGGGQVTLPTTGTSGGDNWGAQTVETDATLIGDGTSISPLAVNGDLTDDQELSITGNNLSISDGNSVALPASPWTETGNNIYFNNENVGIGLDNPYDKLHLGEGNLRLNDGKIIFGEPPAGKLAIETNGDNASFSNYATGFISFFTKTDPSVSAPAYARLSIAPAGDVEVYNNLTVDKNIKIKGGTPGDGKVLTSDTNGLATWEVPNSSPWTKNGDKITYDGPVGIGMTPDWDSPSLTVSTDAAIAAIYATNNDALNPPLQVYNQNASGAAAYFRNKIQIKDGTEGAGKVLTSDSKGITSWQTPATGESSLWTEVNAAGTSAIKYNGLVTIGGSPSWEYREFEVLSAGDKIGIYGENNSSSRATLYLTNEGDGPAAEFKNKIIIDDGSQGLGKVLTSDANGLASWEEPNSSPWTQIGTNIYHYSGNVGIGLNNPSEKLDVYDASDDAVVRIRSGSSNAFLALDKHSDSDKAHIAFASNGHYKFYTGLFGDNNYIIRSSSGTQNGVQVANSGNVTLYNDLSVKGVISTPLEIKSNDINALIIGSSTTNYSQRPGIQFKNNTSQFIAGDDGSDEIFGFYSKWGSTRAHDAKLRIYGNASGSWGKYLQLTHNGTDGFITTDTGDIDLSPAGNVGINTNSPTAKLDVNGSIRVRSIPSGTQTSAVVIDNDGNFHVNSSDRRLKENINTLNNGLDKILKLRGVTFTWKANPEYGTRIGFIAQEFEKVIPELAFTNPVDGYKGINYAEITAVLVEAVKEQQKQIEMLKAENNQLKADNTNFDSRLKKLENMVTGYANK